MSPFDIAISRANPAIVDVCGCQLIVVTRAGGDLSLTGIFSTGGDSAMSAALPFETPVPYASFIASDFEPTGADNGDLIINGADEYRITDIIYDDGGMVHCKLGPKNVMPQL